MTKSEERQYNLEIKETCVWYNDASRQFWLKVKSVFERIGLKKLEEDEVMYLKINEYGNLEGLVSTHVNDFNLAGSEKFLLSVTEEIRKVLDISKIEDSAFRFTGINIKKLENHIEMSNMRGNESI